MHSQACFEIPALPFTQSQELFLLGLCVLDNDFGSPESGARILPKVKFHLCEVGWATVGPHKKLPNVVNITLRPSGKNMPEWWGYEPFLLTEAIIKTRPTGNDDSPP